MSIKADIQQWLDGAAGVKTLWAQRKHLRDTCDIAHDAIIRSGDDRLKLFYYRLFHHPYFSFEPRQDDIAAGDQQTGYVDSTAETTVALGGNGSGKSHLAAVRLADFVSTKPAPEKDVPIWIIANTMEQVCRTCWHEKLRLILPPEWVEWDRISWYSSKRQWPHSVPLVPMTGQKDRNYVLEFHSYEKGREAMQAAAIGAAWFTEAFPWDVFEEVSARCRQYDLPSSIWCEFTPLNPEKSAPIQERYELKLADPNHERVKDWEFYRLSTYKARDAGHITERGFNRIVSSVSEELRDTRLLGAFASYQGAIYQTYNPLIHCKTVDLDDMPRNVYYKRAIDWGASEEHAFVCLWGYKDAIGQWTIFDEYWSIDQTKTALDHIQAIKDRHPWPENSPWHLQTYADPSRPDLIRLFNVNGIPISGAYNAVYDGIEAVRELLVVHPGIGEPMLFIDRDKCPKLARQMSSYRWEQSSGLGVNPKAARPVPLKRDDDAVDCLRYLIATDIRTGHGGAEGRRVAAPARPQVRHKRVAT